MEDYTTISRSSYTDAMLPTMDHPSDFATDAKAQHDLLALLFEKLAIEHRTSNHQLFLELDPERKGVLAPPAFRTALANLGVPLTDAQLDWLLASFDGSDHDGVDYGEFVQMLRACRAGKVPVGASSGAGAGVAAKTGLEWAPQPQASSPFDAREARKRVVLQRYAELLHQAATQGLNDIITTTADVQAVLATEEAAVVQAVLRELTRVAFDKLGGLKRAFGHADGDGDSVVGREDLQHLLEHHLSLVLPEPHFDTLFRTLDFEGTGTIHYFEWIRVLSKYAEETEAGAKPHNWSPAAALVVTSASAKPKEEAEKKQEAVAVLEGDSETAGPGYGEEGAVRAEDDAALRRASVALRERGLHAHELVKRLLPEAAGRVNAAGLVKLFAELGVAIDDARAQRLVARADLMGQGTIVSWELVRLISGAAASTQD